jgi:hypothetical protein
MLDDVLSDDEAREFGLPTHVPGADCKDSVEWARLQSVTLQCETCGNKVTRTLSLPPDVAPGQQIAFTCAACAGRLAGKSGRHRLKTRPANPQKAKRGRPPKQPQESRQTETPFESALAAGLAGTLEFLAPAH